LLPFQTALRRAQLHDGALAEATLDLADGHSQRRATVCSTPIIISI
jgi:hypothetical protein